MENLIRKVYASGQVIFRQGEFGDRAYLVQKGKVEISNVNDEGKVSVLAVIGTDGIFGEMSVIDDQPRMATAKALTTTTVFIVSKDSFREKIEASDPFLRALLKIFVRNIRIVSKKVHCDLVETIKNK